MKTSEVTRLSPLERFLYWIRERHRIHELRSCGSKKPWTDDEILRNYFFTNPYRENDRTTVWFRTQVRNPLRDTVDVILATVIFRWFNYIPTGEVLAGVTSEPQIKLVDSLICKWNPLSAYQQLSERRAKRMQLFTGAYMINSPPGESKLEAIIHRISTVWEDRSVLISKLKRTTSLAAAQDSLIVYPGLGGFMAYEVVCDLRYTRWLENATDVMTWCNPGPGCIRGLYRLLGKDFPKGKNSTSPPKPKGWRKEMIKLMNTVQSQLPDMPLFEMREIEHSLCEYDKYCRALEGDGRLKRRYNGN